MNTAMIETAARGGPSAEPGATNGGARRLWRAVTVFLATGYFFQAAIAGAMISGVGWASRAHRLTAAVLIAATLAAGLVGLIALRRRANGPRLGLTLLLLAAAAVAQAAIGAMSAKGANLAWIHVPLGVALIGLAGQAAAGAGRLGGRPAS